MARRAPVRVAHVIHDLRIGGTERRMLAVLAGLDRERYDPLLVCVDGLGDLTAEATALGLEPIVLGRRRRHDASGIPRLAWLLRERRVEIVHGWLALANAFGRLAAVLARTPVRVAAEGAAVTTVDARRARRNAAVERVLAPITDAYVVNSQSVAASLQAQGIPPRKIVVIPNGVAVPEAVDAAARERLRADLGARPDDELIGMVARLDPDFKDHETFLRVVSALASGGRPVTAAVIGDGPAREHLERRATELGIAGRVVFTGFRRDASVLVSVLDVSVLLSYSEGFSNVLLESMAAGVPLVATAIPPNREAVTHEETGILVRVSDVEQTVAAVRRLLDDRSYAQSLAAAARRRVVEIYTRDAQAQATMALYERLLAAKGR
jgi:glycosyltransferase involved in cell wall biosynthesis